MNNWEERYQQGDTGWDRGSTSLALYTWLDNGALKPCRILIPGCGRGHEVVALAQLDYDVTRCDKYAAQSAGVKSGSGVPDA